MLNSDITGALSSFIEGFTSSYTIIQQKKMNNIQVRFDDNSAWECEYCGRSNTFKHSKVRCIGCGAPLNLDKLIERFLPKKENK